MRRKAKQNVVKSEVKRIEARLRSSEGLARFTLHVYLERMAEAERLRNLASDYVFGMDNRKHQKLFIQLRSMLSAMEPFPTFKGKLPAVVRKFMEGGSK